MIIGLIPISAKPFHDGHYELIKLAESECNNVIVYVSLSDRLPKKKEKNSIAPVYGEIMVRIWKEYIIPSSLFMDKTSIILLDPAKKVSPVKKVYEFIESKEFAISDFKCSIYSDLNDIAKYETYITSNKYPDIYHRIRCVGVDRKSTRDISGTEIRKMIKEHNRLAISNSLPSKLSKNEKSSIVDLLIDSTVPKEINDWF